VDWREGRKCLGRHPFFGLNDNYKVYLHELIFDLCYYGKLEYFAVYEMPVQYRNFYISKLMKIVDKEKKANDTAQGKEEMGSSKNKIVKGPQINRK